MFITKVSPFSSCQRVDRSEARLSPSCATLEGARDWTDMTGRGEGRAQSSGHWLGQPQAQQHSPSFEMKKRRPRWCETGTCQVPKPAGTKLLAGVVTEGNLAQRRRSLGFLFSSSPLRCPTCVFMFKAGSRWVTQDDLKTPHVVKAQTVHLPALASQCWDYMPP